MSTKTRLRLIAATALLSALAVVAGCSTPAAAPTTPAAPAAQQPAPSEPEGTAQVNGDIQRIPVDLSQGFYDPTVIRAKAGVPLEITFGEGRGCLSSVLIPDFGVDSDLTQGGAAIVLPAMKAGEYEFSCGMRMVFGRIVVE